jgi:heme-degrading monooxygenase HmoA
LALWQDQDVIVEHAILDVVQGEGSHFEASFRIAQAIITAMPGFRSLRLGRCVETPSRYLLLVEWDRLEDHTDGFRQSAGYQEWRHLLHHFYDPFPSVEHFEPVVLT